MVPVCEAVDATAGAIAADAPASGPCDAPSTIVRDALEVFQEAGGFTQVLAAIAPHESPRFPLASLDGTTAIPTPWVRALAPLWSVVRDRPAYATAIVEGGRLFAVFLPEGADRVATLVVGSTRAGAGEPPAGQADAPAAAATLVRRATGVAHALEVERRQQRMADALEILGNQLQEAVVVSSPDHGICHANAASLRLLGLGREEMLAFTPDDLFDRVHPHDRAAVVDLYRRVAQAPGVSHAAECRLRHGDEEWRWCALRAVRLVGHAGEGCIASSMVDITDRTVHREFLEYQATHDSLTGLVNRATFDRWTAEMLEDDRPGALLIVDLNRFRLVNSIYGHATGDLLLQDLGGRLLAQQQEGDIISRYGGDEFLIFTPAATRAAAIGRAQQYLLCLRDVFTVRGRAIAVQASVGVACAPNDGASLDQLYRAADRALYRVKTGRTERIAAFDQELDGYLDHADRLAREFNGGIESGAIGLYFQPVCDLRTGEIVACEGLLRWRHPELGVLSPREILPVMVEHGFEDILAKHTLRQAFAAIGALGLDVAVNLSPSQLHNHRLVPWLRKALAASGIAAGRLTIEVTESEAITAPQTGMKTLRAIREMGMQVAIDDFGTGYSDLAAIQTYPADILKIDRGFVSLLDGERDSGAIVRGIIAIAEDRRLEVIAEGIETARQRDRLREMGCHLGQGYLFGRPMPLADLAARLAGAPPPS